METSLYSCHILTLLLLTWTNYLCAKELTCTHVNEIPAEYITRCSSGSWPRLNSHEILPQNTTQLHLSDVYFSEAAIPFLPYLPNLTVLELELFRDQSNSQLFIGFPLREFLKFLDKPRLIVLKLMTIDLRALQEMTLEGLSNLQILHITDGNLTEIHPRSFAPLVENSLSIRKLLLQVSEDRVLTHFSWNALEPLSGVLEALNISGNHQLTLLNISSDVTSTSSFSLPQLTSLDVLDNPKLTSLPKAVLDTVTSTTGSRTTVTFRNNGNRCGAHLADQVSLPSNDVPMGSCELMPLINWARAASNSSSRHLTITCKAAQHLQRAGWDYFWRSQKEPDCEFVSSSSLVVTSSTSELPTNFTPDSTTAKPPFTGSTGICHVIYTSKAANGFLCCSTIFLFLFESLSLTVFVY